MTLEQFLSPDAVVSNLRAASKKTALSKLAELAAQQAGIEDSFPICQALAERERLGSTGIGDGVALPHAKVEGLGRLIVCFAHLADAVDFDAADDEPVDLIAAVIMPDEEGQQAEYLKVLAKISRRLKDPAARAQIRGANSAAAVFALLVDEGTRKAAA